MTRRLLVTTALESSWLPDGPMLFLGAWCRRNDRREQWESRDAAVAAYHWDDREKYYQDYLALHGVYERMLGRLGDRLGALHGVASSPAHWRTIVGPWLRYFSDAVFDRYECIRLLDRSSFDDTRVLRYRLEDWVPADFAGFYGAYVDDPWNHVVFAECLRELGVPITETDDPVPVPRRATPVRRTGVKGAARALLRLEGRYLPSRFNRVPVVSAGIPPRKLWELQRAMGQLPYLEAPEVGAGHEPADLALRRTLVEPRPGDSPFERFLSRMIQAMIPTAYVEGFASLRRRAADAFPSRPRAIVTAGAYQSDEGFKSWAASQAARGVPLVIEQHGGNMGISRFSQSEDHQVATAHTFASWGWTDAKRPNVRPMPAFKLTPSGPAGDPDGDVLLVLASYPRYFYCHYAIPVAGQFERYIDDQVRFLRGMEQGGLPVGIRLDPAEFGWRVDHLLERAGFGASIDRAPASLATRLSRCRLAVSTYNATVFLETLAANFPTLVFFDQSLFEIRDDARPFMDQLRRAGIFHDTPEAAAAFITGRGGALTSWWRSEPVQAAREAFCARYARTSPDWAAQWATMTRAL